jgi:hypothetical protein
MRTTRAALEALGFNADLLRHGIQREVFMATLATNAVTLLKNGKGRPDLSSLLSAEEVSKRAVERWMLPRSERMPEYTLWRRENLLELLGDLRQDLTLKVRKLA